MSFSMWALAFIALIAEYCVRSDPVIGALGARSTCPCYTYTQTLYPPCPSPAQTNGKPCPTLFECPKETEVTTYIPPPTKSCHKTLTSTYSCPTTCTGCQTPTKTITGCFTSTATVLKGFGPCPKICFRPGECTITSTSTFYPVNCHCPTTKTKTTTGVHSCSICGCTYKTVTATSTV